MTHIADQAPQFDRFALCDNCKAETVEEFATKFDLRYLRCSGCGFTFTDLSDFDYQSFNDQSIGDLKSMHIDKVTAPKHLRKYKNRLAQFERYRNTNNLLEIGCSTGGFLNAARGANWKEYGVEPVVESANYAIDTLKLNVHVGLLDTAQFESNSFDVIYSNAVIEHIAHPSHVFDQMYSLLRPGGLMYADTVNLDSYTWQFLGREWKLFDPRVHLSLYTPITLRHFCENAGFQVLNIETHGVRFYATRAERPTGMSRWVDEVRKLPYSALSRVNLRGDSIAVFAIKPE